jgi:hypothetical protein
MRSYVVTKAEALRIGEAQFLTYFLEDAEPMHGKEFVPLA